MAVSAVPYKCPAAPHEGALLIADYFRRHGLVGKVRVHVYTPEPQPMPVAGPALGEALKEMLRSRGIAFHPLHRMTGVDGARREILFDGQEPVCFDLLVAVPPHRCPGVVRDAGLTSQAGWVPVDPRTLATPHERVFAVGDITAIPIPGRRKPTFPSCSRRPGSSPEGRAGFALWRGRCAPDPRHGVAGGLVRLSAGQGGVTARVLAWSLASYHRI